MEHIVEIPGGGLQDFRPGQSSSSSSHFPAGVPEALDEPSQGLFFALFAKNSAKSGSHSSQRVPASASPSTPAPEHRVRLMQWIMILDEHGLYFWNMDTGEKRWQMEEGLNPRWRLLVESASVALELLAVHWYVWLYGGLTEGYSSVSALGSTVDTFSATVGF